MLVFVTASLILSSETARTMLQDTFAAASAVVADHYVLCFVGIVALAGLCSFFGRTSHSMTETPGLLVLNKCVPRAFVCHPSWRGILG